MGQEIKKTIKGKIVFKHETEANWAQSNYVPDDGEMVIYDVDKNHNYKRVKYGDGVNKVKDLPFGGATFDDQVTIGNTVTVHGGGETCTEIGYNHIRTDGEINAVERIRSNGILSGNSLQIDNNIIINEGLANGVNSIAGGTTDVELVKAILGEGFQALIEKYGNIANMPDSILSLIINLGKLDYTVQELRKMLTISPSEANSILSIAFGASNKSISTGSVSLGYGNQSGGKGYYMSAISVNAEENSTTITLSTKQNSASAPTKSIGWKSGDIIYIINDDRYIETAATDVSSNTIKIIGTPFTELVSLDKINILGTQYDITNPVQRSIINLSKPEDGEVEFGWGALSIGAFNTVTGNNALAVGYGNKVFGDFATGLGQENEAGYSAFTAGIGNQAHGRGSVATGDRTVASGNVSHSEGYKTIASEYCAHAEGNGTNAEEVHTHAEGYKTLASGRQAHAEGNNTQAIGEDSHAEGYYTKAIGKKSHAEGDSTTAGTEEDYGLGSSAHAEGSNTQAKGNRSHAEGGSTLAAGNDSHAEGYQTVANGGNSHAEGIECVADKDNSHAEGRNTRAEGYQSHAEGNYTVAKGEASHAEGNETRATGKGAHAEGCSLDQGSSEVRSDSTHENPEKTNAEGNGSHAEGAGTYAKGNYSHAEGIGSVALKSNSHAEGRKTKADGYHSHAEGNCCEALGEASHAEGNETIAKGKGSHAEGINVTAYASGSHAEGESTKVAVNYIFNADGSIASDSDIIASWNSNKFSVAKTRASHVEGRDTLALGNYSHAEGIETNAISEASHTEGRRSKTEGVYAHAEGNYTVASGESAHAEGNETMASAKASHASGIGTIASAEAQTAIGKYNAENTQALFIVGNGTSKSEADRSNAFEILRNGQINIKENLVCNQAQFCYHNKFGGVFGIPLVHINSEDNESGYSAVVNLYRTDDRLSVESNPTISLNSLNGRISCCSLLFQSDYIHHNPASVQYINSKLNIGAVNGIWLDTSNVGAYIHIGEDASYGPATECNHIEIGADEVIISGGKLKIGETTITEDQLKQLLALIS